MGLVAAIGSLTLAACGGGERQDEDEPEGEFPVAIVDAEFPAKQRLAQTSDLILAVRNDGDETIPELAITINTSRQEDASEIETTTEESEESEESLTIDESGETVTIDESAEETEELGEDSGSTEDEDPGEEATASGAATEQANGPFSVISEQEDLAIPSRPVWILEQGYPKLAGESQSAGAEAAQTNTFAFGELDPGETIEIVWKVTPVQSGDYVINYEVAAGLFGKAVAVTDDGSVPEGEFAVQITDVPPQTRVTADGKVVPIKKSDIIGQAGSKEQKQELGE